MIISLMLREFINNEALRLSNLIHKYMQSIINVTSLKISNTRNQTS